jgi:hypothetical protein
MGLASGEQAPGDDPAGHVCAASERKRVTDAQARIGLPADHHDCRDDVRVLRSLGSVLSGYQRGEEPAVAGAVVSRPDHGPYARPRQRYVLTVAASGRQRRDQGLVLAGGPGLWLAALDPVISSATTSTVSLPTSILVTGCALRLCYHAGCCGAPPFAAQMK